MALEEGFVFRVIDVKPRDVKPITELWDQLPEKERVAFRALALELRDTLATATTPAEARNRSLSIIERQPAQLSSPVLEFLALMRKHAWDDRTWAQLLIMLTFVGTLPISGKAAGLAALGSAVRISIPVVGMAIASLVGSGLDLATSAYRSLTRRPIKTAEDHLNRIICDPTLFGGRPCVRRIVSIKDILDNLAGGSSREKILRVFPDLDDADITAALQFASRAMDHPVLDVGTPSGE